MTLPPLRGIILNPLPDGWHDTMEHRVSKKKIFVFGILYIEVIFRSKNIFWCNKLRNSNRFLWLRNEKTSYSKKNVQDLPYRLRTSLDLWSSIAIEELRRWPENLCPLYTIPHITIIMTQLKLAFIHWWWCD